MSAVHSSHYYFFKYCFVRFFFYCHCTKMQRNLLTVYVNITKHNFVVFLYNDNKKLSLKIKN